ncbi:ComF family protein [Candidatus Sumerlaeota bacterium]|nr:ComF family protein [Candidatus Sumerlaeota bacterium]
MTADWTATLRRHGRTLLSLALPPMCPACGDRLGPTDQGVCDECWQHITSPPGPHCPQCGLGESVIGKKCPGCLPGESHFGAARQAALWQDPIPTMIHRLKYHGVSELAEPLARLMARVLVHDFPGRRWDVIVPVPLHRVRRRERGYNQSALIARELGRMLGWSVDERLVLRHRPTLSQTHLSRADRLRNVANAFHCPEPAEVEGRRVLLIDDVHTTGSTLNETARALAEAGAVEIFALAVSRAV